MAVNVALARKRARHIVAKHRKWQQQQWHHATGACASATYVAWQRVRIGANSVSIASKTAGAASWQSQRARKHGVTRAQSARVKHLRAQISAAKRQQKKKQHSIKNSGGIKSIKRASKWQRGMAEMASSIEEKY